MAEDIVRPSLTGTWWDVNQGFGKGPARVRVNAREQELGGHLSTNGIE